MGDGDENSGRERQREGVDVNWGTGRKTRGGRGREKGLMLIEGGGGKLGEGERANRKEERRGQPASQTDRQTDRQRTLCVVIVVVYFDFVLLRYSET